MKDKKKFYILEIVVSTVLLILFVIGLFLPLHFKPWVTPGEAHLITIYVKVVLILSAGIMGYIIASRVARLKNPIVDYPFYIHYDE